MEHAEISQVIESRGFFAVAFVASVDEYKRKVDGDVMSEVEFLLVEDGVRA